ncbi:MAG: Nucleotide-binding protein YvcJ, partial [Alphaproteobacteria bacterium MarineAlpha10_Bin2]
LLAFRLARSRRHIAEVNIRLCFPELTSAQQSALVRKAFIANGIGLLEIGIAWFRDPAKLTGITQVHGLEHFEHDIAPLLDRADLDVTLLFLDGDDEALRRRFTETRRPHPLAADRPVIDGIRRERERLDWLRRRADLTVNTTDLAIRDLRRLLEGHFAEALEPELSIFVTSFSYPRGLPADADLVFDVRFLANPHYVDHLRPLSGLDLSVGRHIEADSAYADFIASLKDMLISLLPAYEREGKSYLTIAVGCTGGRHRSVFVAERVAEALKKTGRQVGVRHRDLDGDPQRKEARESA